jgi:SEC-C motif
MPPFALAPTKTPSALTPQILAACKRLVPAATPLFVDRAPLPDALVNKCTFNVRRFLASHAGEMVLGWDVSVWDGVLLDCIGHAIVRCGESLRCVTPSKYGEQRLLFLPDSSLTFDFEDENARMPATQVSISSRSEVARLIDVQRAERTIRIKYPVSSAPLMVEGNDAIQLQRLGSEKSKLLLAVLLATSDHNTRCPCGSGKKFRKCHRSEVEHMLRVS